MEYHNSNSKDVFADPTYDWSFRLLFGSNQNLDLLISLVNNLLEFSGEDTVTELLIVNSTFIQTDDESIKSTVDLRCITQRKEIIAIEIQRIYEPHVLARSQYYMTRMLYDHAKSGMGKKYHKIMPRAYMLIIALADVFVNDNKIERDDPEWFEKTMKVTILETFQVAPFNEMTWKVYELSKFKNYTQNNPVTDQSSLKHQWLDFLISCSSNETTPKRDKLIKKGYEIMKISKWSKDKKTDYDTTKMKEEIRIIALKEQLENSYDKSKIEDKVEGRIEDEIKGRIKSQIEMYKTMKQNKMPEDQIPMYLNLLKEKDLRMIDENEDETASIIYNKMNIEDENKRDINQIYSEDQYIEDMIEEEKSINEKK